MRCSCFQSNSQEKKKKNSDIGCSSAFKTKIRAFIDIDSKRKNEEELTCEERKKKDEMIFNLE